MWPMTFDHAFTRFRHHVRHQASNLLHGRRLRLESCPLHTERPAWAAMAPAQVAAACRRGAHVIGFTEVLPHLVPELSSVAAKHGYDFYHFGGDVAVAYKMGLGARAFHTSVPNLPNPLIHVEFDFRGHPVTVIALHWLTHRSTHVAGRTAQTRALVAALDDLANQRLGFYLADSNPSSVLSNPKGYPRAALDLAGYPLAYETTGFPSNIGVTTIGHAARDTDKARPVKVKTYTSRGSDHVPCIVTFEVA